MLSPGRAALVIGLAFVALGISACGEDEPDTAGGGGGTPIKIGVVLKSFENEFWLAARDGAEEAAATLEGAEVTVDAARSELDTEGQIAKIENMITRQADVLVVAPTSPDQLEPVLQRAVDQGIKVVLIDTPVPGWGGETAFVGTDNVEGGRLAGEYIAEQLSNSGTLAILTLPGEPSVTDRVKGAREALGDTDVEIVEELGTDCGRERGLSATEDILTAHPDIDAIFAACGQPALAAIEAIRGANKSPDDILLVGFDAVPEEIAAIKRGEEDASIAQFPRKMGELGVITAAKAVRGERVERFVDTGAAVVTKDNAAEFE